MILIKNFKGIILAGGKNKHALKKFTKQEYKALMTINVIDTQPIIYHMIRTLKNSDFISKIFVSGPKEVTHLVESQVDGIFLSGQTLIDTLKIAVPYFNEEPYIFISTCDLPLVSDIHINNFINKCLSEPGFDIYYSIIEKETYTKMFPLNNLRRIYANLVEGSYTGGNFFLINPKVIINCYEKVDRFILFRKHPLKMAGILGRRIAIKYLKKYLSIRDLEKLVPHYLKGYTGKAVLSNPEIALDIDKPQQLEALRRMLKEKNDN